MYSLGCEDGVCPFEAVGSESRKGAIVWDLVTKWRSRSQLPQVYFFRRYHWQMTEVRLLRSMRRIVQELMNSGSA